MFDINISYVTVLPGSNRYQFVLILAQKNVLLAGEVRGRIESSRVVITLIAVANDTVAACRHNLFPLGHGMPSLPTAGTKA